MRPYRPHFVPVTHTKGAKRAESEHGILAEAAADVKQARAGSPVPTLCYDDVAVAVSILIVNYRSYSELDVCLASLAPSMNVNDEIVIVDYETETARLDDLRARYAGVRWLPEAGNRGFAAGVNTAARHARGDYLVLLNPDTRAASRLVTALAAWMDAHPAIGAAGPRIQNEDGSVQPSARTFPGLTTVIGGRSTWWTRHFPNNWFSKRNLVARDATRELEIDWVSGACLITRRALFERLGGLDERFFMYWEDADYCRRVRQARFGVAFVPSVSVVHAVGRSSSYDVEAAIRAFHQSAFRLFVKHAGRVERLLAPAVWLGLACRRELRVRQARRERRRGTAWSAAAVRRTE